MGNIEKKVDSLINIEYLEENNNNTELFYSLVKKLESIKNNDTFTVEGFNTNYNCDEICRKLNCIAQKYTKEFEEKDFGSYLKKKKYKRIYIPTLRGLRRFSDSEDLLAKRTSNDYFGGEEKFEIFTGQNLYKEVLELLCGDFKDRQNLKEFETFLGDSFFDGKVLSLIPKIGSDVLYVKIGEEKEQPIYNLGDGIQSIIILTFKLFSNKDKDVLFFIEEPELYLHPGLQRKMIEIFLHEDFTSYQYFMTSHSNHLLDLTLDIKNISVYKFYKQIDDKNDNFEKEANFLVENVSNDDISVLELLGVNNSSIFLSNCTIWVEGITDRLYIRKYLDIYQKEKLKNGEISEIYFEDINYSFLEYSGGNITHWDFIDDTKGELSPMKHAKICNKIFLIADSDGYNTLKDGMKTERLNILKEYFGERFYCLNAKEIENILTPSIIKSVIAKFKDGRIKDLDKDQDGLLFGQAIFSIEDYKQVNIGEFIDDKITQIIMERKSKENSFTYEKRKSYKKGNTINRKVEFCKYAIEDIKALSDMSSDAIELCKKIYNFIKCNN
ncbi:AAA family ATPase [Clostridium sporogenes]|uniref:AAA family ATPase n=1 Tax=Clostridium sporogenes TaxID=1509 RepID=UPI0013CF8222|nr:AAA family ATPase [Clostridium sporogenes]NFQ66371.1 hypothetical protein [Clostridium sporogenes]